MPVPRARAILARALVLAFALGLALPVAPPAAASDTPDPQTVTVPGTIQSALGCPGDWQPACKNTYLTLKDGVWQAAFDLPAGSYEYKVALNDSWDENYGLKGQRGGANIPLTLSEPARVTFIYDHRTHAVADSINSPIAVVVGSFQSELGCAADGAADCLASWLQDADGDGLATFVTTELPAGTYEANVARNLSLDEVYGADGTPGGPPAQFTVANDGDEIYFGYEADSNVLTISTEGAPRGNIGVLRAYWVSADTILWNVTGTPRYTYELFFSPDGGLELTADGIVGGESLTMSFARGGPGEGVFARFPHLSGFSALKIDAADAPRLREILRGQVAVQVRDDQGKVIDASGLQIPGALDGLFAYDGDLGATYQDGTPTLRVWAPTARRVTLLRFADADPATAPISSAMDFDAASGVWSIAGAPDWTGQYYLYEVEVYVPGTGKIERNQVTDPYSLGLAANSTRSLIVDLDDPALEPPGWSELPKPPLAAPEDSVIYELHIRDFSINDASVPAELRGTFKAFTVADSAGMNHLRGLAEAGLAHVHLLPAFDIATIEERSDQRSEPDAAALAAFAADSEEQQALIDPLRDQDGFNWGYDPYHYTVPEGSYSTDPDGAARIIEFRQMVMGLNGAGLRVVMDVVYNHTNANGQNPRSVLDRIVPGYYHRLNDKGEVENSTCCSNTATEHRMMEKLMLDSLRVWARAYRVDGFRFDLMGHHMRDNMANVRAMLDRLNPADDGVDGQRILLYGEGWNFGEVQDNARGVNATQLNMGGLGIGTFSDRLRDAARGGGPFSGFQDQGFITGLADAPNGTQQGSPEEQRERLLNYADLIRLGLAGNLKEYRLINAKGAEVSGEQINYNGQPAGYALDPQEQVVYVSAHDNETLFDAVQAKAPADAPLAERVRMHNLGMSLVALAQGVPFFHAGDDLLRSKSLDRNSYNSGDWFNRIDWTGQESTWGAGLPPAGDNQEKWPLIKPLLADPALKPGPAEIAAASAHFREMLRIRKGSPLFRLQTAEQVQRTISFANTGPEQVPGLIVMVLDDSAENLDPDIARIVVIFNGTAATQTYADPAAAGLAFALHSIQAASADPVVKTAAFSQDSGSFSVPGRTTAVFVLPQSAAPPTAVATPTEIAPTPTAAATPEATPTASATPAASPAPADDGGSGGSLWLIIGAAALAVAAVVGVALRRRRA